MDPSPAIQLLKKIENYSIRNNEMFFFLLFCTIKKNVLLTIYNFRIAYKNGSFKEYSKIGSLHILTLQSTYISCTYICLLYLFLIFNLMFERTRMDQVQFCCIRTHTNVHTSHTHIQPIYINITFILYLQLLNYRGKLSLSEFDSKEKFVSSAFHSILRRWRSDFVVNFIQYNPICLFKEIRT